MSPSIIQVWADRHSRVWVDTGKIHRESKQPIIELLNGEASGALGWVNAQFGPLQNLSLHSTNESRRAAGGPP
ncbi:hypothetical protein FHU36_008446 [Nonomuraea muscovyensis]|uniref:Uncharacterized protein n=1 Tax=Nonomuraea muscovyensis TaxID=1124761 RepID=A0A7X0CBY7_9ACTN|nr:hypothetical protein [Nonomuraea muscovyensis]MBB6351863.1 hypothetical protein [Nonomuraea muscovyensis]